MSDPASKEFEAAAAREQSRGSLLRDFWGYLRDNKKWWLVPILIMFLLMGWLIWLNGTWLAPFIYTLF